MIHGKQPIMLEVLSQVPIFRDLPPDALARLIEQSRVRTFDAGEHLMRQGEASECMHVVLRGRVQVERSHHNLQEPIVLAELGAGDVVGEMGILDGEPRSATVRALEETTTLEIGQDTLAQLVLKFSSVSSSLLRLLSRRLRTTDELVEELLRRGRN
jgi:CRP-like cAMP-binding protein